MVNVVNAKYKIREGEIVAEYELIDKLKELYNAEDEEEIEELMEEIRELKQSIKEYYQEA